MGATSGIGLEVARLFLLRGARIGAAGRRREALDALQAEAPGQVETAVIDVTSEDAPAALLELIGRLGGMDLYFHSAGIGQQNTALDPAIELGTGRTNVGGFLRMVTAAFGYFRTHGGGHIAAISSIAGTKGLGAAPAYSATKRFQSTYLDALSQLAHMEHLGIRITDIRPGFVDTPLLHCGPYPMLMQPRPVATRIVRALERGRRRIVIDGRYAALVFFWRLVPGWLWERLPIRNKYITHTA